VDRNSSFKHQEFHAILPCWFRKTRKMLSNLFLTPDFFLHTRRKKIDTYFQPKMCFWILKINRFVKVKLSFLAYVIMAMALNKFKKRILRETFLTITVI
jgi:hypothetical protein